MDVAMIERHLRQALEHVESGKRHIARQHEIIAEFRERGADTKEAEQLLVALEQSQSMHLAHRDRLELELKALRQKG